MIKLDKVPSFELAKIVSEQIRQFNNFINSAQGLSPNQIADTTELIIEEYSDLSITSIADCMNRIKLSKPPFDAKLYERVDGRKILSMLNLYRDYQLQEIQQFNKDQGADLEMNTRMMSNDVAVYKDLKNVVKEMRLKKVNDILKNTKQRELSGIDKLTHEWIDEFHKLKQKDKLPPKIILVDQYIQLKYKEHQDQQKAENNAK